MSVDDSTDLLIEPVVARPRLVIAGGGHVALAMARQAKLLDFDVTVIEDRPTFADPARFQGATVLLGDVPQTLGEQHYTWNSFIVIATRGHKLDADCMLAAVRTEAHYIGLLGSRRKTMLIEEMLREHGIADERIHAIHAPVGLDLGGRTPAEIALSVLAEITQLRYQATGKPLGNHVAPSFSSAYLVSELPARHVRAHQPEQRPAATATINHLTIDSAAAGSERRAETRAAPIRGRSSSARRYAPRGRTG